MTAYTKNLSYFTLANTLTFMVFWLIQMNLTWLAYDLTNSSFLLGLLGFVINIPLLLLMPLAGVYSDRFDRKRLIIVCQLLYLLPNGILYFLAANQAVTYVSMLWIGLIYGVLLSIAKPATDAMVYDITNEERQLKTTVSLYSATRQIALLYTPFLSQLVILYFELPGVFLLCAIANSLAAGFFLLVKPNYVIKSRDQSTEDFFVALKSGYRYVIDHPTLLPVILLISCALAIAIALQFQYPAIIQTFNLGDKQDLYYFYFNSAVGGIIGAVIVLMRHYDERQTQAILVMSLLGQAIAVILISVAQSLWLIYAMIFLIDMFAMMATIIGTIAIQNSIDDAVRGRVMSFVNISRIGCIPIASLCIGISTQVLGAMPGLFLFGLVYGSVIVWTQYKKRN